MVPTESDLLNRENKQAVPAVLIEARRQRGSDDAIGRQRQMGTMLLNSTDRKYERRLTRELTDLTGG